MLPLLACSSLRPGGALPGFGEQHRRIPNPAEHQRATPHSSTAIKLTSGIEIPPCCLNVQAARSRACSASKCSRSWRDRAVELADVAERARLHDPAFHDVERELGERAQIGRLPGNGRRACCEAGFDRLDPAAEIGRHQLAHRRVGLVQLERQAADRAAIGAVGVDERAAIAGEQREHALDRVVDARPGRLEQHRADAVAIGFEHRDQHVLLAGEEIIEAAAVDLAAAQDVGDRGRAEALEPEQLHRRFDDPLAGILDHRQRLS